MLSEYEVVDCHSTTTEPFDTDKMALEFVNQFPQQAFTVGQELVFSFMDKKVLTVVVRELEGLSELLLVIILMLIIIIIIIIITATSCVAATLPQYASACCKW